MVTILFLSLFILVDLVSSTTEFTCLKWDLDHWGLHERWRWRSCLESESALSLEHECCVPPFLLLPYPWNLVHCLPLLKQLPWCCCSWHPLWLMLKERSFVLARPWWSEKVGAKRWRGPCKWRRKMLYQQPYKTKWLKKIIQESWLARRVSSSSSKVKGIYEMWICKYGEKLFGAQGDREGR